MGIETKAAERSRMEIGALWVGFKYLIRETGEDVFYRMECWLNAEEKAYKASLYLKLGNENPAFLEQLKMFGEHLAKKPEDADIPSMRDKNSNIWCEQQEAIRKKFVPFIEHFAKNKNSFLVKIVELPEEEPKRHAAGKNPYPENGTIMEKIPFSPALELAATELVSPGSIQKEKKEAIEIVKREEAKFNELKEVISKTLSEPERVWLSDRVEDYEKNFQKIKTAMILVVEKHEKDLGETLSSVNRR